MDAERARKFMRSLPCSVETIDRTPRWGDKLVFRVGEQEKGGKMFAQIDFEEDGRAILSFATNPEHFPELVEKDGIIPAPYRARIQWVALMRWDAIRDSELKDLLRSANTLTLAKLPKRTRDLITNKTASSKNKPLR